MAAQRQRDWMLGRGVMIIVLLSVHLSTEGRQQAQQQAPSASIEGIAVRVGTREPLAGIRVTASQLNAMQLTTIAALAAGSAGPTGGGGGARGGGGVSADPNSAPPPRPAVPPPAAPPINLTVVTDAEGRFSFKALDAGAYTISAYAEGFVIQQYGQATAAPPQTPVAPVQVNAGQELKGLVFAMTPTATITGRVVDSFGKPVVGTTVQVLRAAFNASGQRAFGLVRSATTNDRGIYRAYWITPGRYYVSAGNDSPVVRSPERPNSGAPLAAGTSPNEVAGEVFQLTFYPDTTDFGTASSIELPPGGDIQDINFRLNRQEPHAIRGRVIDSRTGMPPPSINISFGYQNLRGCCGTFSNGTGSYNAATGVFDRPNILTGWYEMTVTAAGLTTKVGIQVSDSDVTGVNVVLAEPAPLAGHVHADGQTPLQSPSPLKFQLRASAAGVLMSGSKTSAPMDSKGEFYWDSVPPGEYRVIADDLPQDYYLKEARYRNLDVLNGPLQFSGIDPESLEIVVSPKAGRIGGTVVDDAQQPVKNIKAVLVPDGHRDRIDLFKTATTDAGGRFTMTGITPGNYKLFAWESLDPYAYFDPEVLRKYEGQGSLLQIEESSDKNVSVRVIPAPLQ